MKLIITLRKISDTSFHREYEFSEFPVKLGRETDNDIVLEDPRKIISRSHAKIEDIDGLIQVLDSGSANFTYLNGEKLFPNDGNALKTGDVIKIGDYELDVVLEKMKKEVFFDDQKTMVFSSPFDSDVQKVADSITKLAEKYFYDESPLKSEMLRISIMQNIGRLAESDVNRILSEYFADKLQGKSQIKKDFSQADIPVVDKPKVKSEPPRVYGDSPKSTPDYSFSTHFSESVDIMLDTIIKLIQGYLHFRQEFFGVTIYQSIPTTSLNEIKEYLFNQDISPEEQGKRINLIKEETQKVLSHQIGLLEGYRASVMEGSQLMLQSLDPEIIEKETANKPSTGLESLLPYSKKIKTLEAIKQSYKKYISDPYHLEKKFFRPSFIKGYQKRSTPKGELNEY
jgi:Uncharacterized conserved protein, contains FHA domain